MQWNRIPTAGVTVRSSPGQHNQSSSVEEPVVRLDLLGDGFLRIGLIDNDQIIGAVGIDSNLPELASAHSILEKHVQVGIGETLGLGKTEVSPDETEEVQAAPEESRLGPPRPMPWGS